MTSAYREPLDKWLAAFEKNPFEALDNLLFERANMSWFGRSETDTILSLIFSGAGEEKLRLLDETMRRWCESYWGKMPDTYSPTHWASILENAFIAVYRLRLRETTLFLEDIYMDDSSWLRSLYHDPSCDPEAALLSTLALRQEDRSLLSLWMRLCGWEEELAIDYTSIGLIGLRKLPDKDGKIDDDHLPEAVFKGIVLMAEAFAERKKPEYKDYWLREIRALFALYPRTNWAKHFSPLFYRSPDSPAVQWLDKVKPGLSKRFKRGADRSLEPPPKHEFDHFIKLVAGRPLEEIRYELDSFFDKHRAYAYQTGDSYSLVRIFSNIGYKLFKQDSDYALILVEEAFDWAPYDPYIWSELAIIESFRGNYARAETLLWKAKRRFPEDPKVRSQLADLLAKQGKLGIAEVLYRQAAKDFPRNVFFRTGLADVLKAQSKLKEAEAVYRETMNDFPRDAFCRTGLAVVLLKKREKEEALSLLKETIKKFPNDKMAKGFFEKITAGKELTEEDEKELEQEIEDLDKQKSAALPAEAQEPGILLESETTAGTGLLAGPLADAGFGVEKPVEYVVPVDTASLSAETPQAEYNAEADELPAPAKAEEIKMHKETAELEKELGEVNLEFWQSLETAAEKAKQENKITAALEKILHRKPGHIPALLLKGECLTQFDPGAAGEFLAEKKVSHRNILGFHLLELRLKGLTNEKVDETAWNNLNRDFPTRSSAIGLERALYAMNNGNGSRLQEIEKLRKQVKKAGSQLPARLQKNDEWVRSSIRHGFFNELDIDQQLSPQSLEKVENNLLQSGKETMLRSVVSQCFLSAV